MRLSGWCHRIRDHGGLRSIDLRDHYGLTQVVADPDKPGVQGCRGLGAEWVVRIERMVRSPPRGEPRTPTSQAAQVEIYITEIEVLGPAGELPMTVFGDQDIPDRRTPASAVRRPAPAPRWR